VSKESRIPSTVSLSRRALLGAAGFSAVGLGAVGLSAAGIASATSAAARDHQRGDREPPPRPDTSFYGRTQAGIATATQAHLQFAALDVSVTSRLALIDLMKDLTQAAAQLTSGAPVGRTGAVGGSPALAPEDTGEALDLPTAGLTITVGFGPTLFSSPSQGDRFGISGRQPAGLQPFPAFKGDALVAARIGGDIGIQACADDAQIAMHAVRNLMRVAGSRLSVRWTQAGFNRAAALHQVTTTPRNLFGFRDGTNNINTSDLAAMDEFVWAKGSDGQAWMEGGSYLAVRQIRMLTSTWDDAVLEEQEDVFGRAKSNGAPLSGGNEFTKPDFARLSSNGKPAISPDSHMALAHPQSNGGARILRRAFSYANSDDRSGAADVGLFFMAYQRDLNRQFVAMQRRLSEHDLLNEYIKHTASAAFAAPPGVSPGGFIGETLLT
jgi:deferrochelatase/peroxidase EfeB